ncbi:hypothetical protein ACET3Z_028290 [Daucus carota]
MNQAIEAQFQHFLVDSTPAQNPNHTLHHLNLKGKTVIPVQELWAASFYLGFEQEPVSSIRELKNTLTPSPKSLNQPIHTHSCTYTLSSPELQLHTGSSRAPLELDILL